MNSQSLPPSSFRFCDQCGSKIFHEQNTCSRCEAVRPIQVVPIPPYVEPKPNPRNTPLLVTVLICVLCGMYGLFELTNPLNKVPPVKETPQTSFLDKMVVVDPKEKELKPTVKSKSVSADSSSSESDKPTEREINSMVHAATMLRNEMDASDRNVKNYVVSRHLDRRLIVEYEDYNTPQKLDIEIRCKIAVQRSSNEEAEQDKLYDGIQSESSFRSVQRTANDQ